MASVIRNKIIMIDTFISFSPQLFFVDKIGLFGGIVGLFTGMSVLSLAEAIFWAVQGTVEAFK